MRLLVDESSCGNDGNEIAQRVRSCKDGADPFKNISGREKGT